MINFAEALRKAREARKDGERGASAVEYGLLIAGIAAVIVVAVMFLGPVVSGAFSDTSTKICDTNASSDDPGASVSAACQKGDGGTTP